MSQQFEIIAKTSFGFEEILAQELREIGAKDIEVMNRAVSFYGDKKILYKANYLLRTALSVMVPIHSFDAKDADELYKGAKEIDWTAFLTIKQTFSIHPTVHSDNFAHSGYAALRVKDAIVDQFREKLNIRPSVDTENPDLKIQVHIRKEEVTILLDSSGESLYKRGYRRRGAEAHLSEVLAAGLILSSGWDREKPFLDPMCGSGTILIEAAMLAINMPAGKFRRHFGFMNWQDYDAKLFLSIKDEEDSRIRKSKVQITGYEINELNVKSARINADFLKDYIQVSVIKGDFFKMNPPYSEGHIIMNPPYGERLTPAYLLEMYKEIGDTLKQKYQGYQAWIISSNMDAMKNIGLKTSRRLTVFNGPLECKFFAYDLYRGTKKLKNSDEINQIS